MKGFSVLLLYTKLVVREKGCNGRLKRRRVCMRINVSVRQRWKAFACTGFWRVHLIFLDNDTRGRREIPNCMCRLVCLVIFIIRVPTQDLPYITSGDIPESVIEITKPKGEILFSDVIWRPLFHITGIELRAADDLSGVPIPSLQAPFI